MLNAPLRITIVAALCALGLIGLVVRETMARTSGTDVQLAMQAIDPRTLLSGHFVYVDLSEALDLREPCPAGLRPHPGLAWGTPTDAASPIAGWVALGAVNEHHRPLAWVRTREEALRIGQVAVRGRAFCEAITTGPSPVAGQINTNLGIDRFYTNQADAERIDRVLRETTGESAAAVFAIVNIGRDGRARLKGLNVNGEIIELNWL
jgi:hypothetical protein